MKEKADLTIFVSFSLLFMNMKIRIMELFTSNFRSNISSATLCSARNLRVFPLFKQTEISPSTHLSMFFHLYLGQC